MNETVYDYLKVINDINTHKISIKYDYQTERWTAYNLMYMRPCTGKTIQEAVSNFLESIK